MDDFFPENAVWSHFFMRYFKNSTLNDIPGRDETNCITQRLLMNLGRRQASLCRQGCIRTASERLSLWVFSVSYNSDLIRSWLGVGQELVRRGSR